MIDALLNSEWRKDDNSDTIIIGTWGEDNAEFDIIVPKQLRDDIIFLQRRWYKLHQDVKRTNYDYIKAAGRYNTLLGIGEPE